MATQDGGEFVSAQPSGRRQHKAGAAGESHQQLPHSGVEAGRGELQDAGGACCRRSAGAKNSKRCAGISGDACNASHCEPECVSKIVHRHREGTIGPLFETEKLNARPVAFEFARSLCFIRLLPIVQQGAKQWLMAEIAVLGRCQLDLGQGLARLLAPVAAISLQGEHIVSALIDVGLCHATVTVERVGGDDFVREIKKFQDLESRDLCSQPTCSRLENLPDLKTVVRLGWVLKLCRAAKKRHPGHRRHG